MGSNFAKALVGAGLVATGAVLGAGATLVKQHFSNKKSCDEDIIVVTETETTTVENQTTNDEE